MTALPDLSQLTHHEDALVRAFWAQAPALTAQVQTLAARAAELEARRGAPPETPDNSSLPPSQGRKPNRPEKAKRHGPRPGSLGRVGGGRPLAENADEIVVARPVRCAPCQAVLGGRPTMSCTGATTRSTFRRSRGAGVVAEVPAGNNGCERGLRPTAAYRKATGGFRPDWGAGLFAGVRSVIGTAARRGVGAYQAVQQTLRGQTATTRGEQIPWMSPKCDSSPK